MEKQDEADYRCKANNLYGTAVSDYARLTVEAGAEIMESPDSSRVQLGEKVKENHGGHAVNPVITGRVAVGAAVRGHGGPGPHHLLAAGRPAGKLSLTRPPQDLLLQWEKYCFAPFLVGRTTAHIILTNSH